MMVLSYYFVAIHHLLQKESLEALLEEHKNSGAAATILTASYAESNRLWSYYPQ